MFLPNEGGVKDWRCEVVPRDGIRRMHLPPLHAYISYLTNMMMKYFNLLAARFEKTSFYLLTTTTNSFSEEETCHVMFLSTLLPAHTAQLLAVGPGIITVTDSQPRPESTQKEQLHICFFISFHLRLLVQQKNNFKCLKKTNKASSWVEYSGSRLTTGPPSQSQCISFAGGHGSRSGPEGDISVRTALLHTAGRVRNAASLPHAD